MWILTQTKDEILEVKRIKLLLLDDGTVNILAKLDRETVLLGNYGKDQAEDILEDLQDFIRYRNGIYEMSKRWEETP